MYDYQACRPQLFTEEGQVLFLKVRDNVKRLLREGGACLAEAALKGVGGDSWTQLACLDRLIELGEIGEVPNPRSPWAQHRIFYDLSRRP